MECDLQEKEIGFFNPETNMVEWKNPPAIEHLLFALMFRASGICENCTHYSKCNPYFFKEGALIDSSSTVFDI